MAPPGVEPAIVYLLSGADYVSSGPPARSAVPIRPGEPATRQLSATAAEHVKSSSSVKHVAREGKRSLSTTEQLETQPQGGRGNVDKVLSPALEWRCIGPHR